MRGEVTTFTEGAGGGAITGDDGTTYRFDVSSIRSPAPLGVGQRVDFIAANGVATEIFGLDGPGRMGASGVSRPVTGLQGKFDIGRVIERTFASIAQNWAIFTVASIFLTGIPSLLQVYGQSELILTQNPIGFAVLGIGWVLGIVGTYVLQGLVVKVAVNRFNGKTMGLGDALSAGVSLFLPLLGLGILIAIGTVIGFMLLIVPGLILTVLWSAAVGAVVVERRGVFESLERSRDLTRGHRWSIFGLIVILFVISMIIGMLGGGIGAATGGSMLEGSSNLIINMATTAITAIVMGVVGSAGAAALYFELRSAKEGVGPEQLASVFD